MAKTEAFDRNLNKYEQWFDDNRYAFLSELEAVRELIPPEGRGVEIGVGSGIFAEALGIKEGCDPSEKMREKAIERGINAIPCIAEKLPYEDESFDFALMVTTICFVDNPVKAIREINRILKPRGDLIIGFVDKESRIGKQYLEIKDKSLFYRDATFFSTREIHELLAENNFLIGRSVQTAFGSLESIKNIQQAENEWGTGSFIVTRAIKRVTKNLVFAMAVDEDDNFDIKQFCEAWRFLVYEWKDNELVFLKDLANPLRDIKEADEPGKEERGKRIINFLGENKISVIVASNFGDNLHKAASSLIPVKVYSETPSEVKQVLTRRVRWIEDELQNNAGNFNLFTIRHGILKTSIHRADRDLNQY